MWVLWGDIMTGENISTATVVIPQSVLPLPGGLDETPVIHSNSPEMILKSGILLSTFPGQGKKFPEAHLSKPLSGRFNVFFHHVTSANQCIEKGTAFLSLVIGNLSSRSIYVDVLDGGTSLTIPDAPFVVLEPVLDGSNGFVFAGPGDRVTTDLLQDSNRTSLRRRISLEPNEIQVILNIAMTVRPPFHNSNGCSGLLRIESTGPVNVATLAAFRDNSLLKEAENPSMEHWLEILNDHPLLEPRDKTPTKPNAGGELVYGRVAGIASGATWKAIITNDSAQSKFIVEPGEIVSFPIATVVGGTLGTEQVQSAKLIARYPDTAYQSHGNYGVLYDLDIPFSNVTESIIETQISFQSPLKDSNGRTSLKFRAKPREKVVFRGSLKIQRKDNMGTITKFVHLTQNEGQQQAPFIKLALRPGQDVDLKIQFYYPADCTPPHVLTISSGIAKAGSVLDRDNFVITRDIITPLINRMRINTMSWLDRLFGHKDKETPAATSTAQVATAPAATTTEIAPERVGLNGEYDQSGLAKRVAKAFDEADFQDHQTVWIAQTGTTVVLKGKVPDQDLLNKMVAVARTVHGAKAVESDQVVVGK
jgi:hypothetical protein